MAQSPPMKENHNFKATLATSTQGTTYLVLIQIVSRALTFAGNQFLLRYLSPQTLGISTQLELYSISVLYFARESLRVVLQRQTGTSQGESSNGVEKEGAVEKRSVAAYSKATRTQTAVNVSYIAIILGLPLTVGLASSYLRHADIAVLQSPYFEPSLQLVGVAAVLELLAEPFFIVVQQNLLYKVRAAAETVAAIIRCLSTCVTAIWAYRLGQDPGVLPFAVGQMGYALALILIYSSSIWPIARKNGFSMLPRSIASNNADYYVWNRFSRSLLTLSANVYFQSGVKHILTQGDSMILALLSTLEDQGVYALASNYGGLIARMLFQPIEESSRNIFARLLSPTEDGKMNPGGLEAAKSYLCNILRAYSLLSVLASCLGSTIVPLLFKLLIGRRWSSTDVDDVLSTYCYYIPLLAFNGITEAFVSSVASNAELQKQTAWMMAFSVGFAGAATFFLRVLKLGAQGLVWANIINMTLRTAWSTWFIRDYFRRNGLNLDVVEVLPNAGSSIVGIGAAAILYRMKAGFVGSPGDIAKAIGVSIVSVVMMLFFERPYLMEFFSMLYPRSSTKKTRKSRNT